MGRDFSTRARFAEASRTYVPPTGPATRRAEEQARVTGKLHELVDPAGYGVIRRSLLRFEQRPDGLYELTIGCSMPVETRLDTTGSMGGNVDVALKVLADLYELCGSVLPGYDLHIATGIFGDVVDRFVLCRPQFEMLAEKIVQQLTLMVPERGGGDSDEDPHYGLFGAAYLTAAYVNCIGLKRYDFTVSDARARRTLSERQLIRIYGEEVFDKVAVNGFQIDRNDLPTTKEVVQDLLKQAHAFFLQVADSKETTNFWTSVFGPERVIVLPDTKLLPQVQAVVIGLTEGTLSMGDVADFLRTHNVSMADVKRIERSVANIPIGAQAALRKDIRVPQKGDLFQGKPDVFKKTNLWPIDPAGIPDHEIAPVVEPGPVPGPNWL